MPVRAVEKKSVRRIADEFARVASTLRSWPEAMGASPRGVGPAGRILRAMTHVNATLRKAHSAAQVRPAQFRTMARDFGTIAGALRAAASAGSRAEKKTTKKRATAKKKTTKKRTRVKRS